MVSHVEGSSGKFPTFIICRGFIQKQSTSLEKQPSQTLPQKTSTNNVKVSPDHSQEIVHNSAPASTQFHGYKRLVSLENRNKYSGKAERNTHSHIPTSDRFQLLQHLSTDSHTVGIVCTRIV